MAGPLDWLRERLAGTTRLGTRKLGADAYPLPNDHPLRDEHLALDLFVREWFEAERNWGRRANEFTHGAELTSLTGEAAARMAVAADQRWHSANVALRAPSPDPGYREKFDCQRATHELREALLRRKLPLTDADLMSLIASRVHESCPTHALACGHLVKALERRFAEGDPTDDLRAGLVSYRNAVDKWSRDVRERKLVGRMDALLGRDAQVSLDERQVWAQTLREDLAELDDNTQRAWVELLAHAQTASAGKPSKKWSKTARALLDAVGDDAFEAAVARWMGLVDKRSETDGHGLDAFVSQDTLKGLCWIVGLLPGERRAAARALAALALSATRPEPGYGIRSTRVCNAAVYGLGCLSGLDPVGQLAVLRIRIRHKGAQKGIEKALTRAAEREGLPRDELEEMAVPAYGLTEVGVHIEEMGEHRAELRVVGTTKTTLTWSHATKDGKRKTQKSVPAAVKRDHAEQLKELKGAAKDIQKMLPAQRDRIDALFLMRRTWPFATWRERYLDHPLVGTLARRIIWTVTDGGSSTPVCWSGAGLTRVDDTVLGDVGPGGVGDDATVALWHPIEHPVDEVLAWREWLERHGVVQPFKQAHREVYLLTDAERTTEIYSNRFASHVLKQHQFSALCGVRGWNNRLRLMVDDEYPPAIRDLPEWGVRAEFWIEGIGDSWETDVNEVGAYLRVATDQIRFYPINAAMRTAHAGGGGYQTEGVEGSDTPIPLADVPPLVLSEVLRDVDLFVGVASVGNDPTWQDGGPEGRFRTYWENYSFGDLSGTARTRKALLERLVPRLKIADACTVTDRFLEVRGTLRGYRIHLGSGNILMTPNDQYLCIVPGRGAITGAAGKVILPFEGDRTLSVILSKAFMLAADDKITDTTITSQIRR